MIHLSPYRIEAIPLTIKRIAAVVYMPVSVGIVAFQIARALVGVPWGAYAMGGACPERFPPALRIGVLLLAALVLARAGVAIHRWARVPTACLAGRRLCSDQPAAQPDYTKCRRAHDLGTSCVCAVRFQLVGRHQSHRT